MSIAETVYSPTNPNWFYSYVDIPNLAVIQHELINLLNAPGPQARLTDYYITIHNPYIVNCPKLTEYLTYIGINSKLLKILFSVSNGPDLNQASPHVDSTTPFGCKYSLNIPLIDAEDSYIVWYEKTDDDTILYDTKSGTGWIKKTSPVREIARAQYTQPMLLNTSILHGGKISKPTRVIAGLRFLPELALSELRRVGVYIPMNYTLLY